MKSAPIERKNKDYLIETFKFLKYHLYKSKSPVKEAQLNIDYFSPQPHDNLYFIEMIYGN